MIKTILERLALVLVAFVVGATAYAQKPSTPVLFGTGVHPAFANDPAVTLWIDQQGVLGKGTVISRFTDGDGGGPTAGATPAFLRLVGGRGTPDASKPNQSHDFVTNVDGRVSGSLPFATIDFSVGVTTIPKLGELPDGSWQAPGYIGFRTAPEGSWVPLPVLLLQQSVPDATVSLTMNNIISGGDFVLQVNDSGRNAGLNITTQGGGSLKVNGSDLVARIAAIEAKLEHLQEDRRNVPARR
jgi:hypothetical protein